MNLDYEPGGPTHVMIASRRMIPLAVFAAAWSAQALAQPAIRQTGVPQTGIPGGVLPAMVQPASQEHHVGKMTFALLVTPDLAGAKSFYTGLFGWSYQDVLHGEDVITESMVDGRPIAALISRDMPAGGQRQPAWLPFLAVRDVDAAQTVAVQNGAKVLYQPHNFAGFGREAVLADPQGAVFAILASAAGDPPDLLAEPGEWIWSSLITSAPDPAAAFYQTVFDYNVFDVPDETDKQHLILSSDDVARGSINPIPAGWTRVRPHWVNYVRVDDAAATAAKAVTLGGRVLVPAQRDRHGGELALVADPTGAVFGVMEWPESGPARGAK